MVEVRGIPISPSCNFDTMLSRVELELKKKPEPRKSAVEPARGQHQYSDCDASTAVRPTTDKPAKELLQYRGKRSATNWDNSDSGSSSHYDETELCSQGTESTTSDFFSGSDHTSYENDLRSDLSLSPNQEGPSFASGLRSPQQAFPPMKHYRYCWYCYDVYSAMCLAQGKNAPDIHNRGLWRGHCMKDAHGVTT
ncbi:hypothetical protein COOONC_01142 [Cooperia oncophora]